MSIWPFFWCEIILWKNYCHFFVRVGGGNYKGGNSYLIQGPLIVCKIVKSLHMSLILLSPLI